MCGDMGMPRCAGESVYIYIVPVKKLQEFTSPRSLVVAGRLPLMEPGQPQEGERSTVEQCEERRSEYVALFVTA